MGLKDRVEADVWQRLAAMGTAGMGPRAAVAPPVAVQATAEPRKDVGQARVQRPPKGRRTKGPTARTAAARPPRQPEREKRPFDVRTVVLGPESDRSFMDPTSSK